MATPIKYTDVHLYATNNTESAKFRQYLDKNLVNFVNLTYVDKDSVQINLDAISTWFIDPSDAALKIKFTKMPFLIFEQVYWEAEDGTERYIKRTYAMTIKELPEDFMEKVEKLVE